MDSTETHFESSKCQASTGTGVSAARRSTEDNSRLLSSAFWELRQTLAAMARRITGSQADAEEFVQEAFLRSLTRFGIDAPPTAEHPRRRLFIVVRRAAIDSARRPRAQALDSLLLDSLAAPACEPLARWRTVDTSVLWELLEASSGPAQDGALRLRVEAGLSYQEIARLLGIPTTTVGTRLHRAVRKLRQELPAVELSHQNRGQASGVAGELTRMRTRRRNKS
jgi:RNA polymerase sigma-70 factor (ECF subfamily)